MARCPECNACLGRIEDGMVIQKHYGRVSSSPIAGTTIHCDRRGCDGIWPEAAEGG